MPLIAAAHMAIVLKAVLAFVVFGTAAVTTVAVTGFPDGFGVTGLPQLAVQFGLNPGPFADSSGVVLEGYDTLVDIQQLLDYKPTPTLPLQKCYGVPSYSHLRPIPTLPPTRNAEQPPAPATSAPAPSLFAKSISTLSAFVSHAKEQQVWRHVWAIACGVFLSCCLTAIAVFLPRQPISYQKMVQLGENAIQLLVWLTITFLESSHDLNIWASVVIVLLLQYLKEEESRRAAWQAVEQQRLFDIANTFITETLVNWKAQSIWIANEEFERLRKAHQEKLDATYDRNVLATADIELNFGPSLQNAEAEVRGRLSKISVQENRREDIIGIFMNVLYSFTYAMAVEDSRPEGQGTRYLSVIEWQRSLIESLCSLNKYREEAYAESEELIRMLCRYDKDGRLIVPDGEQAEDPWGKYSKKDDKFIVSPPDGPTALSMMASLSAAPLQTRPDTLLDSDPNWRKFPASVAAKRPGQEARLASMDENFDEEEVRDDVVSELQHSELQKGEVRKSRDLPLKIVEEDFNFKQAVRQDVGSEPQSSRLRECEVAESKKIALKTKKEDPNFDKEEVSKDQGSEPQPTEHEDREAAETKRLALQIAEEELSLLKWKLRYLESGFGTPEDPSPKPFSDADPPASTAGLTGDALIAMQLKLEEEAIWRSSTITALKRALRNLEEEITMMHTGIFD